MSQLDDYIDRAGAGSVLMVSQRAMDDIRHNTDSDHWRHDGLRDWYRGALVELHDEWSWGWMVRKADGTYVEPASAIEARRAETRSGSVADESPAPSGETPNA